MAPGDQRRARPLTPRPRPGLSVAVSDERGRVIDDLGLGRWLARVAPARARGSVAVALAADGTVQALNRRYRRRDRPTDVLSFPAGDATHLGDIVIARGVARRQARSAGHDERTEIRLLALHGLLHLLGYDHHHDGGTMARVERRLRRKGGLREGLIERAGRDLP